MKKFVFPLARVLAWRRAQATLERNRLEQIYTRQRALLERRDALRNESLQAGALAAQPGAHSTPGELTSLSNFALFARQEDVRLEQAARAMQQEIARQQGQVQQAEQRCRLLEKLEGQRLTDWQAGASKELEELASDVFLAKWPGRKRSAGG